MFRLGPLEVTIIFAFCGVPIILAVIFFRYILKGSRDDK